MKLIDYINKNYNGVHLRFAKANNMHRQQVEKCLAKGYYYVIEIDGIMRLAMAKREIK